MKYIKKIFVILLCCAIILLSACTKNQIVSGYDYNQDGTNTNSTLRVVGGWTKTGIGTHFHSGPDAGPVIIYSLEGLMQYVRTSDKFFYLLAESFEHYNDSTSIITIREDATWHDGSQFVAMDILSYYALCVTDFSKYTLDMEVVDTNQNNDLTDDKQLKIYWKPWKEPTDYAKNMLLAMDTKNGSVQYQTFKNFVDRSLDLIYNGPEGGNKNALVTEQSDNQGEMRLGRHINPVSGALGSIYNEFRAFVVPGDGAHYLGTGPYIVEMVSENQMLLVKNENYYLADKIGFDKILATQYSNTNQLISDMKAGKLDYVDGANPEDINLSILNSNKSMVSYKYYDQGAIGLYYNLEKSIWDDDNVRLAFQYIFNRDALRKTVMPYGVTSYFPMMMMSPIEARQYMSSTAYNMIEKYSYDRNIAKEKLILAGWEFKNNAWYDQKGTRVSLTIGYENNVTFLKVAQTVKAELERFGIQVVLKSGNDWATWFSTASSPNSLYDCVIAFTELNTYGTHPAGSMKHFFDILQAHVLHLNVDSNTGKFSIQVDLLNPNNKNQSLGKVTVYDIYQKLYTFSGAELENYVDSIILGYSKYNYGVQFYENVTGSYFDASRVGGLPSADLMFESRNILYLPEYFDPLYKEYALLNVHFTQATTVGNGIIYAKK